jgi:hypothetical protein
MKLKSFILISGILATLYSCSDHTYAPALFHQDIAYQPKPASYDTAKSATYISMGLNYYLDPTWTAFLASGQFNISRGYVFNHFNLAYGAFGALGNFDEGTFRPFGAYGARASANLFNTYDRMDFRYLGVEMAYSNEFGDYANYRKSISNLPGYHVDTRTQLFTMGLTSEVIFHNEGDKNISNGLRFFVGYTFGNNTLSENYMTHKYFEPDFVATVFPKISYFLKVKNFIATIESGKQIFVRAGYSF